MGHGPSAEYLIVMFPFVAYSDILLTIIFIILVFWIVTSIKHARPYPIKACNFLIPINTPEIAIDVRLVLMGAHPAFVVMA